MKQNPFSLYDFLGYFIPGAILIYTVVIINSCKKLDPISIEGVLNTLPMLKFEGIVFLMLLSYSIGHILSFLSSIIIEKYSVWMYGYPSRYLLKMKVEKFCSHFAGINGWAWGIFMILIMFPTVLFDIIIGNGMGFKVFYVRPLDPPLSKVAVFKVNKLAKILGITKKNGFKQGEGTESDFFRIIQHYTYDNSTNHQSKFTNYVSLYGFLRTMTLIMNLLFWYLILHFIIIERFDMTFIVLVFLASIIGYIFFMSFMKFYRRYTVEGFMVLISDKNVK